MALIIEDGTIVAGANSFTTDAELTAYATARGVTLPATEAERDILQIKATDFLNSFEPSMSGVRASSEQELIYPRRDVEIYGYSVASDSIPLTLKKALLEAAIVANTTTLLTNEVSQNEQRKKIDSLEISYFSGGKKTKASFQSVQNYLAPLLRDTLARC